MLQFSEGNYSINLVLRLKKAVKWIGQTEQSIEKKKKNAMKGFYEREKYFLESFSLWIIAVNFGKNRQK